MKSIDLMFPPVENDNSQQLAESDFDSNKLIESLTQKISEVVDSQNATTEKLAETIETVVANSIKNIVTTEEPENDPQDLNE